MGNQSMKSPSLEIKSEPLTIKQNTPIKQRSIKKIRAQVHHNPMKDKKCSFVYIAPKNICEESEIIKGFTLCAEQQQENLQIVEQQALNENFLYDREANKSTLARLCIQKQKQTGKVVVQWNQFIKIKNKSYLEDYIHIKQIGKGSFGAVSKVCKKNGKLYRAAKIIKISSVTKKKANRDKLVAEILIMMKTDHPNINKLYQVYQWKKQYVLIMDLCEGGDLFNMIKKQRAFSQRRVADIIKQIMAGVLYLHKNRIAHRDLKPENLLYDKDSKLVKICDFGTGIELTSSSSKMHQLVGSPLYIAPEVISGSYNEKCDVWSCGVILYIMLCGAPPFSGSSQQQIFDNIKSKPLLFTNSVWKKRSAQCKKLVSMMLIKDPEQRISIADAINSAWLQKQFEDVQKNQVTGEFINNLTRFYFQNKLKAVVYTYIASQLFSNKDKQSLMKCFKDIDKDNDGVIEKDELLEVFRSYKGENFPLEKLQKIIELVDTNQSGHIDFTEFLVAASNQQQLLCRERLQNAFSYFDTDNSGYITAQEIRQFLDDSEETNQEIEKIFKQVDVNGDGKIELNQFIALLLNNEKPEKANNIDQ